MLGLAEFRAAGVQLQQLAQTYDQKTATDIAPLFDDKGNMTTPNRQRAVLLTQANLNAYYDEYEQLLYSSALESGDNAASHYAKQLGSTIPESLVPDTVGAQYARKYYGATLAARLVFNRARLLRKANNTAAVGAEHLTGVLTKATPFGAQITLDRRLLLSTMVKVEHDIAKQMAKLDDIPLIRWTLSHMHKQPDVCDDLATHSSKRVVEYLEEREVPDVNPKGLYFLDDLPRPPHPNCQCEYALVAPGRPVGTGTFKRTLARMRALFNKIRKK